MPELPEVETIMRATHARLHGQTIDRIVLHRPDLRWPMPQALGHALDGHTIESFARRSKYILMRTSGGQTMLWHLGMSGRIDLSDGADTDPRKPHEHVVLTTREGARCGLVDPRRFGAVDLVRTQDERRHKLLSGIGIEPLSSAFGAVCLEGLLAGRRTPIKTALLDQRLIAGLGNIYVCEALYRARIHPERRACDLTKDEVARIAAAIPPVLNAAIAAGGSSLRDYRHPDGELGYFQTAWAVYGREGEACPGCKKPPCPGIRRITQGGRSTFYCPRHQKTPV